MNYRIHLLALLAASLLLAACSRTVTPDRHVDRLPAIYPDYIGVTLPPNIAPPCFALADSCGATDQRAIFTAGGRKMVVELNAGIIAPDEAEWKLLVAGADAVKVRVLALVDGQWEEYREFTMTIAPEPIDSHLAYRLIEPGYETWNEMGIYQRDLTTYNERAIITNKQTNYGCMNCHSFCMQSPDTMMMHFRVDYGGTYIYKNGEIDKLNTKTPETISALVYPSWHPTGKFIAFSTNTTKQMFHTTSRNRVEVMDFASDVVVYDVERKEIFSSPLLMGKDAFETFPTFSPDGRTLYFCSADSVSMPLGFEQVKYSLCAISYDPSTRSFGDHVDTLFNARAEQASVSFPRVSPDGKWLMFTKADYGNFSIWHREADLWMVNLATRAICPLTALNSPETDSYHSWSSNSRWVVFSSRRLDGLYTRPFIAHIDANGKPSKPFLLPQRTRNYYQRLMKSYNIPELVKGEVTLDSHQLSTKARNDKGVDLKFVGRN